MADGSDIRKGERHETKENKTVYIRYDRGSSPVSTMRSSECKCRNVPAGSELPRLVDDADILTDSEEKELNQQLEQSARSRSVT